MDKNKTMQYRYFDSSDCKIIESDDEEERTLIFKISDETLDRYKEIMTARGCMVENYRKNPVVLWAHNRSQELPPIGKALWIKIEEKSVKAKVQFAPTEFATTIYNLYKEGYMNGISVGYTIEDYTDVSGEDSGVTVKKIINKWDLLEFSAVPVPANPNALVEAGQVIGDIPKAILKDFGEWKEKAGEFCNDYFCRAFPCEIKEEKFEDEGKPFPNEHSCVINDREYPKYRRANCEQKHNGKCIDVMYGIIKPGESEISSLRYKKDIWTEAEAKAHCKSRKGKFEPAKKDSIPLDEFLLSLDKEIKEELRQLFDSGKFTRLHALLKVEKLREKREIFLTGKQVVKLIGNIEHPIIKVINVEPDTSIHITADIDKEAQKRLDFLFEHIDEIISDNIDLESIEDKKNVEIELDKLESSQAGPENSGDEIEITKEEYDRLVSEISKAISEGFAGEFRKKILGIVDD